MEAQSKKIKDSSARAQDIKNVEKQHDDMADKKSFSEKPLEETNTKQNKDDFEAKLEEKFYGVFWLKEKKHLFSVTSCNCMG